MARFCNLCGKELDEWDQNCDFSIQKSIGYGSIYDGDTVNLHLCIDCFDGLVNSCVVDPLSEG